MTTLKSAVRASRKASNTAHSATLSALDGGEMMKAASEVISARLQIMADGLANPLRSDLAEMSLMSSEKVEAMSSSAATLAKNFGDIGGQVSKNALNEIQIASRAASAMASAATPAGMAQAQMTYALGWWSRASRQMLDLNADLVRTQSAAMKPIHDTAVANAKRLKR